MVLLVMVSELDTVTTAPLNSMPLPHWLIILLSITRLLIVVAVKAASGEAAVIATGAAPEDTPALPPQ